MFSNLLHFKNQYSNDIIQINRYILKTINQFGFEKLINPSLVQAGKRIRSILALNIFHNHSQQEVPAEFYKILALLELTHLASLLHDDVIDQNKIRRNSKSLYALYGAKQSILLGDYLLIKIFEQVSKLQLIKYFIKYTKSTAYGALLEQKLSKCSTMNDYIKVAWLKTSSLFALASTYGAYFANIRNVYYKYAICFGIVFQAQNDLNAYNFQNFYDNEDYINNAYNLPIIVLNILNISYLNLFYNKNQENYLKLQLLINSNQSAIKNTLSKYTKYLKQ